MLHRKAHAPLWRQVRHHGRARLQACGAGGNRILHSSSDFEYLARFLVQKGLCVVCPDIIGRGASTYFGNADAYDLAAYLTCIGALSKYAGDRNHFIGTAWGGAIALYFLFVTHVKAEKLVLNDVALRNNQGLGSAIECFTADSQ